MKKTILTIAAIATLASCETEETHHISQLNELRPPVIVKGMGRPDGFFPYVLLVDGNGRTVTMQHAVFDHAKVGDTIIPSPWKPFKQGAVMNKYAKMIATRCPSK